MSKAGSRAVAWALAGGFLSVAALAGRYEDLTAWAAKGPKMTVEAATFFGGTGAEGFVDAVELRDGTLLALGNAYGPDFAGTVKADVWGKGQHSGAEPFTTDKGGKKKLKDYTPDMAGFMVGYSSDLRRISKTLRFDWGVATIRSAALTPDGGRLVLAGYCRKEALTDAVGQARVQVTNAVVSAEAAGRRGPPPAAPAPAYVAALRLGPNGGLAGSRFEWVWVLEKYESDPDALWLDQRTNVLFAVNGVTRISGDGRRFVKLSTRGTTGGQSGVRGIDPKDGGYFVGGDRNTNTGHQPWRQPFLYKYDDQGTKVWKLWEWPPKSCACGGDGNGLCSDSSVRRVGVAENGDLVVIGWSDGGNSVFTRQPTDVTKPVGKMSGPFSTYGFKSASSVSYVMRLDPQTFEQKAWSYWMAYLPMFFGDAKYRGAPNTTNIEDIEALPGDRVALTGGAATGLISTPNAFYKHTTPNKYGGRYAAVLSKDFSALLFSSYLPGYHSLGMTPTRRGLLVTGTTAKDDGHTDQPATPPPSVNAVQSAFGGGETDGHLILLVAPPAAE